MSNSKKNLQIPKACHTKIQKENRRKFSCEKSMIRDFSSFP